MIDLGCKTRPRASVFHVLRVVDHVLKASGPKYGGRILSADSLRHYHVGRTNSIEKKTTTTLS